MAIFYNYIKGINQHQKPEDGVITKIFFPSVQPITTGKITAIGSMNYPVVRLYDSQGNLKQDLGEIITSKGEDQTIEYLNCNHLTIAHLHGTNVVSTGDVVIGTEKTSTSEATGNLTVNGTLSAPVIKYDTVEIVDATISNTTTISNADFKGTIQLGKASITSDGVLTVNKINFV